MEALIQQHHIVEGLDTGYGMNLLCRVKAELSTCQLLIVLVREIQAVVQEVMQTSADAVIFKSSLSTGKGDVVINWVNADLVTHIVPRV